MRRLLAICAVCLAALVGLGVWLLRADDAPAAPLETAVPAGAERRGGPEELEVGAGRAGHSPTRESVANGASNRPLRVYVVDSAGLPPATWWVEAHVAPAGGDRAAETRLAQGQSKPVASLRGSGPEAVEFPAELRQRPESILLVGKAYTGPDTGYLQSDWLALAADSPDALTLVVLPPTTLAVRVEGPRPSGDLRFEIAPVALVPGPGVRGLQFAETPEGEARFHVEHSVAHRVRVAGPGPDDVVDATAAPLGRGQSTLVLVRFPGSFFDPLPAGYAELALAGRVESEGRDRPGLWATVDGGLPISITVRADGSFELMHVRGKSVELHAAGDDYEARFEPEVSTHPFGTRDVVLRGRPGSPRVHVRLRIVDAETGEPVRDTWVNFQRMDGSRQRGKSLGGRNAAEIVALVPALDDLEYVVRASDRRDARGFVFPAGPPPPDGEVEHTIRLERGFRREFTVLHCSERTPIAGAEVAWDGQYLGRSDAEGRLLVELDAWPGRLTVRAAGFDEGSWPPSWQTPVPTASMMLCPVD